MDGKERGLFYPSLGAAGFYIRENCSAWFINCASINNSGFGVFADLFCYAEFKETGTYSENGRSGLYIAGFSRGWFYEYSNGEIKNNKEYGIWVKSQAHVSKYSTGNTIEDNLGGNLNTDHVGYLWE